MADPVNQTALSYEDVIAIGAKNLAPDEYWVINHDEGALWDTASKRLDYPVRVFCDALSIDWDEAREQGFHLAVMRKGVANAKT